MSSSLRILIVASAVSAANALSVTGVVTPTKVGSALNGLLARRSVAKYDTSKQVPEAATQRAVCIRTED